MATETKINRCTRCGEIEPPRAEYQYIDEAATEAAR